jgi:hypothetical protein
MTEPGAARVGLSICTPPPADAEGNPACNYRDGWESDPSGSGISVFTAAGRCFVIGPDGS